MSAKFKQKQRFLLPFSFRNMVITRVWIKGVLKSFRVGLKSMMDGMNIAAMGHDSQASLIKQALTCDYHAASFSNLSRAIFDEIRAYDPEGKFGETLAQHLEDVQKEVSAFLIYDGYDPKKAAMIGDAAAWHDLGKILQNPAYWRVTLEKREKTEDEKTERPRHTTLGPKALDGIIERFKFKLTQEQLKFIDLAKYTMVFHHERIDGEGPHGIDANTMPDFMHYIIVVDTFNGKIKAGNAPNVIYEQMCGNKHLGHLHIPTVESYGRFKGFLPPLPKASPTCTLTLP